MNCAAGKSLLEECLHQFAPDVDIDQLLYCTHGNKKSAKDYQKPEIVTMVTSIDNESEIRFVVKCFIHFGVYAAWRREIGQGNGKYPLYKRQLVEMENEPENSFTVAKINRGEVYLFRGREGITQFFKEVALQQE